MFNHSNQVLTSLLYTTLSKPKRGQIPKYTPPFSDGSIVRLDGQNYLVTVQKFNILLTHTERVKINLTKKWDLDNGGFLPSKEEVERALLVGDFSNCF